MAENKKSFVLYADQIHVTRKLTREFRGDLLELIMSYVNDEKPDESKYDLVVQVAFESVKQHLKRDLKKWEHKKEVRSDAGRIGGLKSGESRQSKQNEANASKMKQTQANEAVSVNVNVSDNVNVIKRENRAFAPPTQEDVCNEMMKTLDDFTCQAEAAKFMDYYTSNGWKVGKNPMKDWKSAVRNWNRNLKTFKNGSSKMGTSEARIEALKEF